MLVPMNAYAEAADSLSSTEEKKEEQVVQNQQDLEESTDAEQQNVVKEETLEPAEATAETDTSNEVTTEEPVALQSEGEEVSLQSEPAASLQADDGYLTDKIILGTSTNGVYMSIKGTDSDPYLYMEPINGNDATVVVGFYDWDAYTQSDYYTKVITPYASKITKVKIKEGANVKLDKNCSCLFSGMPALTDISDLSRLDTSGMTYMAEMFSCDAALTDLSPISGWNVSSVKMMYLAFRECTSLATIAPLASWTTTSLTDVSGMFYKDEALTDISALSSWNTDNIDEMYNMLSGCTYLTDISAIQNWKTGKVTNMTGLFGGCSSLSDFSPVANWDLSSNTQLQGTFAGCALTDTNDLAKWGQQGNVENISMCFAGCPNLSDLAGLSGWTIKPTIAQYTFMSCPSLKTLDGLENWDMSQCQYFTYMFCADTALEDISAIGNWQPGNAVDMSAMFANDVALKTIDLTFLANDAAQTQAFAGIDVSKVRHFKLTELQTDTEAIMTENNICNLDMMEVEGAYYQLRDTDKVYSSWNELLADWDAVSGQWIDVVVPYTVKFYKEKDFTQDPIETITGTEDEAIGDFDVTEPTKTGYTFAGWYYELNGTETEFNKDTVITDNINVYAKWTVNKYTVTFNTNGGSSVTSQSVEYNKTATKPADPTKAGYTFENWYSDSALTTVYNFSTPVTDNINVYAKWTEEAINNATTDENGKATITDPVTGKKLVVTVSYKDILDETADPTPIKDAVVSIDENGKIKVYASEGSGTVFDAIAGLALNVNVSTEDGVGVPDREVTATIGYFDLVGTTDENGDASWTSIDWNIETQSVDIKVTNGQIETQGFLLDESYDQNDYTGYSGISVTGNPIKKGENAVISYKPNDGYSLKSVTIDGVDKTSENPETVTFEAIDADHSVEVVYEKSDDTSDEAVDSTTDDTATNGDLAQTGDNLRTGAAALIAILAVSGLYSLYEFNRRKEAVKLQNKRH